MGRPLGASGISVYRFWVRMIFIFNILTYRTNIFCVYPFSLDAVNVQECIKKRHLTDKLIGKPEKIATKFISDLYPLLSGTKYQLLLLYYVAVEKLCGDLPIVAEVQVHRTLLRHFMKFAPGNDFLMIFGAIVKRFMINSGLDYKKLVDADDPTSLDVVMPYLNADNFKTFAKVLTKIPTKNVTLENVFSVWARKVFVETMPKVKMFVGPFSTTDS